ncbi:MAG: TonB-dependent receptor plug domain-containing protein [Schleiferiaceae bacterium]
MRIKALWWAALVPVWAQAQVRDTTATQMTEVEVRAEAPDAVVQARSTTLTTSIGRGELKKAACCNLSESFETNPAIDAAFTDAVTGTRQIQLMGLDGKYAQIQTEMTPLVRGLLANSGLQFIPGTWVEGIQLTKGIGAVTNGFESITGQVNVELLKPDEGLSAEKPRRAHANAYLSNSGRMELNGDYAQRLSEKWYVGTLLHANQTRWFRDMNTDGFADNPLGGQVNGMLRARYWGQNGWEGLFTLHGLRDVREGGQLGPDAPALPWTSSVAQQRSAFTSKTGWVSPDDPDFSVGIILHGYQQKLDARLGPLVLATSQFLEGNQRGGLAQVLVREGGQGWSQTSGLNWSVDRYVMDWHHPGYAHDDAWIESAPGAFSEWTLEPSAKFTAVVGARVDRHSILGWQFSPRAHLRYAPTSRFTLRGGIGRGYRMAMPSVESLGRFASARRVDHSVNPWGSRANEESGWTASGSAVWNYVANYYPGSVVVDVQASNLGKAMVLDFYRSATDLYFYSTELQARSASIQWEHQFSKNWKARAAYRLQDVQAKYFGLWDRVPYVAPQRIMLHAEYQFRQKWFANATWQHYAGMPLPAGPGGTQRENRPRFALLHGQIRRATSWGDAYLGVENALNVRQDEPVLGAVDHLNNHQFLGADDPSFASNFDATRVWGPIFGRMFYLGINLALTGADD